MSAPRTQNLEQDAKRFVRHVITELFGQTTTDTEVDTVARRVVDAFYRGVLESAPSSEERPPEEIDLMKVLTDHLKQSAVSPAERDAQP